MLVILFLASLAMGGASVVDLDLKVSTCALTQANTYDLRKEQGGTAVTQSITEAEFSDLLTDAAVSRTAFDATASSILGAWWSNLPDTTENPGKTAFYVMFVDLAAAD